MSYVTEIFERMNLQQIRSFLTIGVDCFEVSQKTYVQRIEDAGTPVFELLEKEFSKEKNELISGKIYDYMGTLQDVYLEIGIQCGAKLAMELFLNPQMK